MVDILQKRLRRIEYARCVGNTVVWGSVLLVGVWDYANDFVDSKLLLQLGNGSLAWIMELSAVYNAANRPVEAVSIITCVPVVTVFSVLQANGVTMPPGFVYQTIVSSVIVALVLTPPIVVFCTSYGDPGYERTKHQRFGDKSYMLWTFSIAAVLLVDTTLVISATVAMQSENRMILYVVTYVYGNTCMGTVRGLEAQHFNGWITEFFLFTVNCIMQILPTATALWTVAYPDREQAMRIIATIAASGCTVALFTILVTRGAQKPQTGAYQRM